MKKIVLSASVELEMVANRHFLNSYLCGAATEWRYLWLGGKLVSGTSAQSDVQKQTDKKQKF